jgi:hypothetical protein
MVLALANRISGQEFRPDTDCRGAGKNKVRSSLRIYPSSRN